MTDAPVVLLVEDDKAVVDTYKRTFGVDDVKLDVTGTWEEALALFRVAGHRLVIADYNLPGDRHGLKLLIDMKLLVPSTEMILISGALSKPAEELAKKVPLIDHFYPKGTELPDILVRHALEAIERFDTETDWMLVGQKYLTPEDDVVSALEELDEELRADVARRSHG